LSIYIYIYGGQTDGDSGSVAKGERQQGTKEKDLKNEISMRPGGRGGMGGKGGVGGRGRGEGVGEHQEYDREKNEKWKTDSGRGDVSDLSDFEHAAQGIFLAFFFIGIFLMSPSRVKKKNMRRSGRNRLWLSCLRWLRWLRCLRRNADCEHDPRVFCFVLICLFCFIAARTRCL
jgi:hypothetical protein